jgi:DNA primase
MIPKETIDQIIDTARIDEVVGDFVALKKRGVNMIGLCPFHNEKTPSFTVSPAKGIYKCFGCGAGGNSLNFVMEHEHLSYPEGLRYLAKKYNIHVEEEQLSPDEMKQDNERESLFVVSGFAQKHYTQNLFETDEGKSIGLSYFSERGFSLPIVEKFQLGYAVDKYDDLLNAAKEKGYKLDILEKAGLLKQRDERWFDFFRGRVIFPIHNVTGKVIAFGARTLKSDKKEPKYLNSPETEIYYKSKILYGIYFAKKSIIANDNCFLVEGYTDVVSLFQSGIENVVASSGTSLTVDQIRLVKRYTQNITILYDGDAAGIKASFRGIDMILEEGMNVKVLLFPDGEDPDSYSKKVSTDEFHQFIKANTKDFILFKTGILYDEAKDDPIKKAALIRDLVGSIALIPDHITRSVYTRECSKLFEIPEQALINELNKNRRSKAAGDKHNIQPEHVRIPEPKTEEALDEMLPQERDIVRILLNFGERELEFEITVKEEVEDENGAMIEKSRPGVLQTTVAEFIIFQLESDHLRMGTVEFARIVDEYSQALQNNMILTQDHFIQKSEGAISKAAIDLIASPHLLSHHWKEKHHIFTATEDENLSLVVRNVVYSYKLKKVMDMIYELQQLLKTETEEEKVNEILEEQTHLIELKKQLSAELGRVIIK